MIRIDEIIKGIGSILWQPDHILWEKEEAPVWGAGAFLRKEEENELSLIDDYIKKNLCSGKWDDVARTEEPRTGVTFTDR